MGDDEEEDLTFEDVGVGEDEGAETEPEPEPEPESGEGEPESGGGEPESDGGEPESDGGEPESDGGEPESDGGEPESDEGEPGQEGPSIADLVGQLGEMISGLRDEIQALKAMNFDLTVRQDTGGDPEPDIPDDDDQGVIELEDLLRNPEYWEE